MNRDDLFEQVNCNLLT